MLFFAILKFIRYKYVAIKFCIAINNVLELPLYLEHDEYVIAKILK